MVIYITVRAFVLPIFHDEAATFYYYIQSGEYWPFFAHWDANNHLVNSLFSNIFYSIFGQHQGVLRLANVLSAVFFYYWLYLWGRMPIFSKFRWPIWIALGTAHFFIEFFSHSRGYGISFAFLVGMLYQTQAYFQDFKVSRLWVGLICLILTLHANLTLVNSSLLWVGLMLFFLFLHREKIKFHHFIPVVLGLLPIAYALVVGLELKKMDLLYYGTPDTFWNVSGKISLELFFGTSNIWAQSFLLLMLLLSAVTFVNAVILWFKDIKKIERWVLLLPGLFFWANILAIILMHQLFATKYPEDRVALHLFPLLIFSLATPLNFPKLEKVHWGMVAFVALVFGADYLRTMNVKTSSLWSTEVYPMDVYDHIGASEKQTGLKHTIAGHHLRELDFSFNNSLLHDGEYGQIQSHDFPSTLADFQLIHPYDLNDEVIQLYDSISGSEITGLTMFKRKKLLKRSWIKSIEGGMEALSTQTYFNFIEQKLDSNWLGKPLLLEMTMKVNSPEALHEGWWVYEIRDKEESRLEYDSYVPYWQSKNWHDGRVFHQVLYTGAITKEHQKIISYFWNNKQKPFQVEHYKLDIYQLEN